MSEQDNLSTPPEANPSAKDQSIRQMSDGAKQIAHGAKAMFEGHVAPATRRTARTVKQALAEQKDGQKPGVQGWVSWAPFALPVTGFLGIFSLFLPMVTGYGRSLNFFSRSESRGEGIFLIVAFLLVIASSIYFLASKTKRSCILAGTIGGIGGLIGCIDGFGNMAIISDGYGSVGAGAVLLSMLSTVILVASILALLGLRKSATDSSLAA
ncbi:hypothetical protein AOZ07_11530 [Glutamicibacter halophytocola]|uniref:hypothetical protein n=1 Tax=Glutamicibacter halophytocola TaxID=1933880 RepID=UPI0006D4B74B|nr:hypothetical protein [Glutamicibacter halophytocola]ALG29549.1 hypothetical protein AOZ07_11530 [Glutamicibacter halophytocola]